MLSLMFFFLFTLLWSDVETQKKKHTNESQNTCVHIIYTRIRIMCWVARNHHDYSVVWFMPSFCAHSSVVVMMLLLPSHGQTFTIYPQCYAFFCTISVDSPFVFVFLYIHFLFAILFFCVWFFFVCVESVLHLTRLWMGDFHFVRFIMCTFVLLTLAVCRLCDGM